MAATALFPQAYANWLKTRLPGSVHESLATCDSCAMVKPHGLTRDPGPFSNDLKCCTYFPFIPNFGIGGILKTGSATAHLRMQTAARQGLLLPTGLFASPERETLMRKAGQEGFGKHPELLCPFFDSAAKGCSIWANRPAVCATYFCKSDRGETGLEFWSDLEQYLNYFEWTLANAVTTRLGFDGDLNERCEAAMLTEQAGPERDWLLQSIWGEWHGREELFFQNCLEKAHKFSQEEISALLGEDGRDLEESLKQRT